MVAANLPQQRIFRDSFLQGKRHGRAMLALQEFFDSLSFPLGGEAFFPHFSSI